MNKHCNISVSDIRKAVLVFFIVYTSILHSQNIVAQVSGEVPTGFVSQDTLFTEPYIDIDEWRDVPVRHRYVHGGFKGTDTRFSFYFPPDTMYQKRFFQYITPFPDNENLSQGAVGEEDKISFSISSGAYFIETNGGGKIDFSKPGIGSEPSIGAYRANAASAGYSRIVAARMYGNHRPYGYCFGGSGGAFRTVGGFENTTDVWDGAVPYVMGSPVAIPNVFSVRMHAMRVLKDKFPQIIDALEPGGSGDMYAGLNEEEKEALQEVTKMGFPPGSWFGFRTMGVHGFLVLYQSIVNIDRQYFANDFWNTPGYLGASPTQSLLAARVQRSGKISRTISVDEAVKLGLIAPMSPAERGTADAAWKSLGGAEGTMPVAFELEEEMPDVDFLGGDLIIRTGNASGKTLQLTKLQKNKVALGPVDPAILLQIKAGDEVQIDNSNFLAVQTYHRHQVPGKEYYVWDQFRDTRGNPIYPQRPMQLGPLFTLAASGVLPTGKFRGKMILVDCLWDREAFPWQGDWYLNKVKSNPGMDIDKQFRLWYIDHALHGDETKQEDPTRTVSYLGVLHQALRDLSAWVENGEEPSPTTAYKIEQGQVIVPLNAKERRGIQPVVFARVNGAKYAAVNVNREVTFVASVEIPDGNSQIVSAEWDFEGNQNFPVKVNVKKSAVNGRVELTTTYSFNRPGTYFPTIRVASQRKVDGSPFALIQNLDRVRVVVR